MKDFATLRKENHIFDDLCDARDDIVRAIDYHQKMDFELRENLEEWDHLIKTRNFHLAKQKLGV